MEMGFRSRFNAEKNEIGPVRLKSTDCEINRIPVSEGLGPNSTDVLLSANGPGKL